MKFSSLSIKFLCFVPAILLGISAHAQFFTNGDDPFGRWYSIESQNYRIIYPKGLDSLARVYAGAMEKYRIPVSATSGFVPGQAIKVKMPVVLHGYTALSNGSVAWAPKRMDAFTIPQMYGSEAHPWVDQLTVHESRHLSQMQFGISNAWKPFKYIFGEMFNGLSAGLLTESSFLEGDAVIAETELTKAGRGRSADFLNYYMVCFDQGDLRDWDRWRYGSQRYFTPDHYGIGYLTYGGIRWYYDNDDFTARYLEKSSRRPYMLWVREVIAKETGGLNVVKSFKVMSDSLARTWSAEADGRAPYMQMERVSEQPRVHADYTDFFLVGDDLYCLKEGMNDSRVLIRMKTDSTSLGEEKFITRFSTEVGQLHYCEDKDEIIWSESIADARWSLKYTSNLRRMRGLTGHRKDVESGNKDGDKDSSDTVLNENNGKELGEVHDEKRARSSRSPKTDITKKKWMYNPVFSPDGKYIAAVEVFPAGGCAVTVMDEDSGEEVYSMAAPDTLQLVEPIWTDDGMFLSAISENGYGIYRLLDSAHSPDSNCDSDGQEESDDDDGTAEWDHDSASQGNAHYEMLLAPQPVKVHNLRLHEGKILFTSDHNGVNELYSFDIDDNEVHQFTSTRYGGSDYEFSEDGKWLYYSSQTIKGKAVYRTKVSELVERPVDWNERHRWIIADKLSEQAQRRAAKLNNPNLTDYTEDVKADRSTSKMNNQHTAGADAAKSDTGKLGMSDGEIALSDPKRWYKLPHLMHFHSWAPFYFNVPKIMDFSGEKLIDYISLGATALFQNTIGTADGSIGYSAHRNPDENNRWVHAGHFYMRYSGLYPVIEAEVSVGERSARQYCIRAFESGISSENGASFNVSQTARRLHGRPYTEAKVTVSIPWNFSSGGWHRRLKPSVRYTFTNDRYDTRIQYFGDNGTSVFIDETAAQKASASGLRPFLGTGKGRNIYRQTLNASLLYYSLLPTTNSAEYPRWGFGAETGMFMGLYHKSAYKSDSPAGYNGSTNEFGYSDIISPLYYARVFGYFPGFTKEQGLKLSMIWQHRVNRNAFFGQSLAIMPRGFESKYPFNGIGGNQSDMLKISADYAVPIYVGDRAILGGCIFIKRLLLIPYLDCTVYNRGEFAAGSAGYSALESAGFNPQGTGFFMSYGTQFMLDMTNVLWLSLPMRLGIDFCLNGAPGFKDIDAIAKACGTKVKKYFVGPVFSITF